MPDTRNWEAIGWDLQRLQSKQQQQQQLQQFQQQLQQLQQQRPQQRQQWQQQQQPQRRFKRRCELQAAGFLALSLALIIIPGILIGVIGYIDIDIIDKFDKSIDFCFYGFIGFTSIGCWVAFVRARAP